MYFNSLQGFHPTKCPTRPEMTLSIVPFRKKFGEDLFMEVARLWNAPKIRYNADLYKKVFESIDKAMDDPSKDGDVLQSLYEYEMHRKKYFPGKDQ